jgi:hypothetical protein
MTELEKFETDVLPTSARDLAITFFGHGSLLLVFKGMHIYVDGVHRSLLQTSSGRDRDA